MASSIFHTLSLILFHLLLASSTRTVREQSGFRATLTRVHSGQTSPAYTSLNLNNDPSDSVITSPMKAFQDVYFINLSIGTPPVPFSAMMDTGSDLIWTKCKTGGSGSSFDTSKSTSYFSMVDTSCPGLGGDSCVQNYADGSSSVSVSLGQETLIIGNEVFNNVTFGCGKPHNISYKGIIGMGRGELSLVSQLKLRVFSYCLGSRLDTKTSSVLLTGSKARREIINNRTTPFLKANNNQHYYYISLEGISIGETKLPVTQSDFAMTSNGDGGMIIDSGTTFTYLDEIIVNMISNEFFNQTKLGKSDDNKSYKGDLKHCFKFPGNNDNAPKMVFHFENANWELLPENYIYREKGTNVACLAFIANNENEDSNVSIFGNWMQQNMMVIYDLENNNLSFKPENCNKY